MCIFQPRWSTHHAQSGPDSRIWGHDPMPKWLLRFQLRLKTLRWQWRHIWVCIRVNAVCRIFWMMPAVKRWLKVCNSSASPFYLFILCADLWKMKMQCFVLSAWTPSPSIWLVLMEFSVNLPTSGVLILHGVGADVFFLSTWSGNSTCSMTQLFIFFSFSFLESCNHSCICSL